MAREDNAREDNASEVRQLRIPAERNASFDRFLSALKRRILDQAVRRASVRAETDGLRLLRAQDSVAVAQVALREAAYEVDRRSHPASCIMSKGPREYDLDFDAANELEEQASRARRIMERLAAHFFFG